MKTETKQTVFAIGAIALTLAGFYVYMMAYIDGVSTWIANGIEWIEKHDKKKQQLKG